jgi:hypothetical protein
VKAQRPWAARVEVRCPGFSRLTHTKAGRAFIFREELEALSTRNPNLSVTVTMSNPEARYGLAGAGTSMPICLLRWRISPAEGCMSAAHRHDGRGESRPPWPGCSRNPDQDRTSIWIAVFMWLSSCLLDVCALPGPVGAVGTRLERSCVPEHDAGAPRRLAADASGHVRGVSSRPCGC